MNLLYNVASMAGMRTGIGRYSAELANRARLCPEIATVAAFNQGIPTTLPKAESPGDSPVNRLRGRLARWTPAVIGTHYLARAAAHVALRRFRRFIYHETNYVAFPHRGPLVLSVHDLSYLRFPQFHPPARVQFLERFFPDSLRRADLVITDAEFIRQELIDEFSMDSRRVRAVPLGVDRPAEEATFNGDANTILCVGSMDPRKNLAGFFRAYETLPRELRASFPIRHVGPPGWPDEQLTEAVSRLTQQGHLQCLGFVSDEALDKLYRSAALFVFPSFYEGFGLPMLEAMIRRVPVIAAESSSIPEVLGNGALTFPPGDEEALRHLLERALTEPGLRRQEADRGYRQAVKFNWETTFSETLALYKELSF